MSERNEMTEKLRTLSASSLKNAENIARSIGQAFYVWDIASDKMEWSRGLRQLVGLKSNETRHLTGREFEQLLDSTSLESRFGTVLSGSTQAEDGQPVAYQCVYSLKESEQAENANPIWIEDKGHWFPDDNGRPMRAEGVVQVITERRNREEELRRKSDFDDQTGLPNRRTLETLIYKSVKEAQNEGTVTAFLLLNLERLDLINDIYGFETGDFVLKKAGEIIRERLRAGDSLCRFSGSKFGVLLNNCPPAEIYDAGHRLLKALSSEVLEAPGGHVSINGVIGACFLPQHAETPNEAFHAAYQAMKSARSDSHNRIGIYFSDNAKKKQNAADAKFSSEVIHALENDRLKLVFQPVVSHDGKAEFYEALVRMESGDKVVTSAQEFIDMVERLGLVRIVDKQVLKLVLQTLRDYPDANLSVNVSHDTVLDPEWLSNLATGLVTVENGAARLMVEITESLAATDLSETKRFIENVKALGCRVAIDDFGAGFTSFANLKYLPVDVIKIDGSFGLKLSENAENQAFIKSLLSLAKAFEMKTVVEWVEDPVSAEILFDWKVDYLQGFEFGRASSVPPWEKRADADQAYDVQESNVA